MGHRHSRPHPSLKHPHTHTPFARGLAPSRAPPACYPHVLKDLPILGVTDEISTPRGAREKRQQPPRFVITSLLLVAAAAAALVVVLVVPYHPLSLQNVATQPSNKANWRRQQQPSSVSCQLSKIPRGEEKKSRGSVQERKETNQANKGGGQ